MQALKEWAVVCRALEQGRQTVLLRKGGILEFRQGFEVKHDRFMLFPTFEHQTKESLQADFADRLDDVLKEQQQQPLPANRSVIKSYAEATLVREITDVSALKKLEKYHIWNESYVNARMAYNPKKPMSVILVRTFVLDDPLTIENRPEWAGCRSWVPVELPSATGRPAVDDDTFSRISSEVREALQ
jgi:hypothetical protein